VDLRIFVEPQQGASYDDQLAVARTAEDAGFDAFFRSDHYVAFGRADGLPGPTDSWTTLAGLARETSRIRLGTLVSSATFRHPGVLAIQVAQVDQMSRGRVELGLGAGWNEVEHAAYGVPFPPTGERFDRLEEQLAVVTGLWSTPVGERFSFEGRHYRLSDSPALPKPVQQPVPVVVGGSGPRRTPELAARFASEYNANFTSVEKAAQSYRRVRAACERVGRDPDELTYSIALTVVCGADDAQVRRRAAAIGRDVQELRDDSLAGTPDEVVDRLSQYAAAGCRRAYLQVLDMSDLDHVAFLGAEVLPHVRSV
jgi:F420-dependent oxidoreductase-like protein